MVSDDLGAAMSSRRPRTGKIGFALGCLFKAALGVLALALLAGPAAAQMTPNRTDHGVQKIERTVLPYWLVGNVDKALGRLCSLGQFNQRTPYRFSGQFYGPYGAAMLGAAKGSGLNLWDPFKHADAQHDYWFYRDRTSACIVLSARVKDANAPPAVPQPAAVASR
jgi:hypothetical protein